jgi:hypothetical protein
MGSHQQIGTPPMPAVARILSRYDRAQLEAFLTIAIDLLDTFDGDADLEDDEADEDADPAEENGDETDGVGAEDEEVAWFRTMKAGPGCTVSDSDFDDGL